MSANYMQLLNFNTDCVRRDAGFCYLIEFSSGILKAGKTIDLFVRYEQHKVDAEKSGAHIVRIAHTSQHDTYGETEQRIISLMSSMGSSLRKEYFFGISFDDAVEEVSVKIAQLTVSSCVKRAGTYQNVKMVSLRVSNSELEALETAAAGDKLKLTTWIKQAAMKAADSRREHSARTENNQKALCFTE